MRICTCYQTGLAVIGGGVGDDIVVLGRANHVPQGVYGSDFLVYGALGATAAAVAGFFLGEQVAVAIVIVGDTPAGADYLTVVQAAVEAGCVGIKLLKHTPVSVVGGLRCIGFAVI